MQLLERRRLGGSRLGQPRAAIHALTSGSPSSFQGGHRTVFTSSPFGRCEPPRRRRSSAWLRLRDCGHSVAGRGPSKTSRHDSRLCFRVFFVFRGQIRHSRKQKAPAHHRGFVSQNLAAGIISSARRSFAESASRRDPSSWRGDWRRFRFRACSSRAVCFGRKCRTFRGTERRPVCRRPFHR